MRARRRPPRCTCSRIVPDPRPLLCERPPARAGRAAEAAQRDPGRRRPAAARGLGAGRARGAVWARVSARGRRQLHARLAGGARHARRRRPALPGGRYRGARAAAPRGGCWCGVPRCDPRSKQGSRPQRCAETALFPAGRRVIGDDGVSGLVKSWWHVPVDADAGRHIAANQVHVHAAHATLHSHSCASGGMLTYGKRNSYSAAPQACLWPSTLLRDLATGPAARSGAHAGPALGGPSRPQGQPARVPGGRQEGARALLNPLQHACVATSAPARASCPPKLQSNASSLSAARRRAAARSMRAQHGHVPYGGSSRGRARRRRCCASSASGTTAPRCTATGGPTACTSSRTAASRSWRRATATPAATPSLSSCAAACCPSRSDVIGYRLG